MRRTGHGPHLTSRGGSRDTNSERDNAFRARRCRRRQEVQQGWSKGAEQRANGPSFDEQRASLNMKMRLPRGVRAKPQGRLL